MEVSGSLCGEGPAKEVRAALSSGPSGSSTLWPSPDTWPSLGLDLPPFPQGPALS